MYGVIIEKGEPYYTYLSNVFSSMKEAQNNYNWLITDCICYPQTKQYEELLSKEYCFITGEELTEMIKAENFQWIWAVLTGFDKAISLEEILKFPLPNAQEYEGFWKNPINIQHSLGEIEIVPWDSSLTLIISKEKKLIQDVKKAFPLSQDLTSYNEKE